MKTFVSASSYFRKEYGGKVYKIALSADTTCPNRDGSKGIGGCIFCSASGSGDFAYPGLPVKEQLIKAKALVEAKIKGPEKRYIAYFQNFTNTYGERTRLEALFEEAIADDEVVGLSIATRPDCLGEDILSMLSSLSRKTKLIVELGLQTSNEETGRLINRAYSNDDYIEAMKKLKTIDCHTITHVIFGLPGETGEDMMNTVRFVSENKSDGIKISTLHVLRGTRLEALYNEGCLQGSGNGRILHPFDQGAENPSRGHGDPPSHRRWRKADTHCPGMDCGQEESDEQSQGRVGERGTLCQMKPSSEEHLLNDKLFSLALRLAIPTALAQAVMVLYAIVDRMFIGHIPDVGATAIAGVGIAAPITTFISSFAVLVGLGGAPIMAMRAGHGEKGRAENVLGTSLSLLLIISAVITPLSFLLKNYAILSFGASPVTFPFAEEYTRIYLIGTPFALLSGGLNSFVINQGRAKEGMVSLITGAALNLALDPLFIFTLNLGVKGAAAATVISQAVSALLVLAFLKSKNSPLKLRLTKPKAGETGAILSFGLSPFIIIATDSLLLILLNTMLQRYGGAESGDSLITAAAIIQSYHMLVMNPLGGITGGCQAMISYNYGAGKSDRVKKGIIAVETLAFTYTLIILLLTHTAAGSGFVALFTNDEAIRSITLKYLKLFTAMIPFLALQYTNVDCFTAMGEVKFSLPLSLFRKSIFLISLLVLPPLLGAGASFLSEPLCDLIAGITSSTIMLKMLPSILKKREERGLGV
jgi:putative efflux protein, MATE family